MQKLSSVGKFHNQSPPRAVLQPQTSSASHSPREAYRDVASQRVRGLSVSTCNSEASRACRPKVRRRSQNGEVMEFLGGFAGSVRLRARELDYLAPPLG